LCEELDAGESGAREVLHEELKGDEGAPVLRRVQRRTQREQIARELHETRV